MGNNMIEQKLKFRVWDTKNKQFINAIPPCEYMLDSDAWDRRDCDSDGDPQYYINNILSKTFNGRLVFQQFTGAVDKNGKEIYDGDIVKVRRFHIVAREVSKNTITTDLIENGEEIGYVFWPWCQYKWLVSYEHIRHDDFDDFNGIDHRHEIIGNICENPELVKYGW